ncbi:MAG TPA: methyltransferase domain-containing protein [Kineosporiaceae bacterium]|nr:methyltransferase domain-containing protein [Kineosporiaceae bacterium]
MAETETDTKGQGTTGETTTGEAASTREPTPFAQVDEAPPELQALILSVLELMAATPEIGQVRRAADALLRPAAGERILDAGCGAGEAARALAATVGPEGQVTAIDASRTAVEHARSKDDGTGVEYRVADVTALPFDDDAFDAVRCERVLQHLTDPDAGLAELVRVTRSGGRVCLIDTDWESMASDGLPDDLVEAVTGMLLRRTVLHHSAMGRTLRRRLVRAGLTEVSAQPVTICFTDPDRAAAILPIFSPLLPAEAGMIPNDVRESWFEAIAASRDRDEFLAVLTMWVAVGTVAP